MQHNLIKTESGWSCTLCKWDWKSKPRTDCPGIIRYSWSNKPADLKSSGELERVNLKPKPSAQPEAGIYSTKSNEWIWLYSEKSCEKSDPLLPPVYAWDNRGDLKTLGELKKQNLAPIDDKSPRGVAYIWDKEEECVVWISLYHLDDCQWQPKDQFITKSTLKQKYLLSDGWIKKLGDPDKKIQNPHGLRAAPIQLYSKQRVERFLADNAEEYANWLDKRDKYLAVFLANKDKIFARRNLIKEQTARCLKCASGCSTPDGFLCAIHPMEVPLPCPDYHPRKYDR